MHRTTTTYLFLSLLAGLWASEAVPSASASLSVPNPTAPAPVFAKDDPDSLGRCRPKVPPSHSWVSAAVALPPFAGAKPSGERIFSAVKADDPPDCIPTWVTDPEEIKKLLADGCEFCTDG